MTKPVILTGLRANNDLHIGNYFGALLPIIDMAKKHAGDYQINLFVPDLHSFTTPIDHAQLQAQIMNALKVFVAAGLQLDNPDVHIYRQSYIPAHSELTVILNSFTGFGEMSRMTQFKDKGKDIFKNTAREHSGFEQEESVRSNPQEHLNLVAVEANKRVTVGLFDYPVLMAADILLYDASYIPVGDDQSQHLEYARNIAMRINSKFGELFTVPKSVKEQHEFFGKDQGLRIKDLVDPTKKMSKSTVSDKGVIFLNDDPEVAAKKVMGATTDSLNNHDYENLKQDEQPGVYNLLQISSLLREYQGQYAPMANYKSYGALKANVAAEVKTFLTDFQTNLAKVDEQKLLAKLEASETAMNEQANKTLYNVQKAVGLRPKN